MDDKTECNFNILYGSSSSYVFLTESVQAFVCCPRLDVVLENAGEVSSFREFGVSFQIFGANEERASLPLYIVFALFLCNALVFIN